MLDKDKIWIQAKVFVGQMTAIEIEDYIGLIGKHLSAGSDESVRWFVMPTTSESEHGLTCIYSPYGKDADEQLKVAKEYMEKILSETKNVKIID